MCIHSDLHVSHGSWISDLIMLKVSQRLWIVDWLFLKTVTGIIVTEVMDW